MSTWEEEVLKMETTPPISTLPPELPSTTEPKPIAEPVAEPSTSAGTDDPLPSGSGVSTGARKRDPPANKKGKNLSQSQRLYSSQRQSNAAAGANPRFNRRIILLPSHQIGRVIGRGGTRLRELEFAADVRVKINGTSSPNSEVIIYGTDDAIDVAEKMLYSMTESNRYLRHNPTKGYNKPPHPLPPLLPQPPPALEPFTPAVEPPTNLPLNRNTDLYTMDSQGIHMINWDKIAKLYARNSLITMPPVLKNLYQEDETVAAMTPEEINFWRKENNIQVKRVFGDTVFLRPIPNPVFTFEQVFGSFPDLINEIKKRRTQPTVIQSQAWPIILSGEDLICIAPSEPSEVLSYLLPAFIHIDGQPTPREQRNGPAVLILAPSRATILQIENEISILNYRGMTSISVYAGEDKAQQMNMLSNGVDIVIGTPGRINKLLTEKIINIQHFSFMVLVAADRMLDMGFETHIKKILDSIRYDKQIIMTTAFLPTPLFCLAQTYMCNPIQLNVGFLDVSNLHSINQKIVVAEDNEKDMYLIDFLTNLDPEHVVIIFCEKMITASNIANQLALNGISAQCVQGDTGTEQSGEPNENADTFHATSNIIVATDASFRYLDNKSFNHIVNFDFPMHMEVFLQRMLKSGLAGKSGSALTFLTKRDLSHSTDLVEILKKLRQEIPSELEEMSQMFEAMSLGPQYTKIIRKKRD